MEEEILFEENNGVGIITLNRPKSLNALTLNMIRQMDPKLEAWEKNDAIKMVLIKGAGEKAFCAGGDVRAVWEAGQSEDKSLTDSFFREEYVLNRRIHNFPKPYIAFLHGVTMGGGVGLSVHGSHRIVTETTLFAMPETAIGLFPDVGGSWFLNNCPGESGMYLALTGARLNAADCIAVNMATDFVQSEDLEKLQAAFCGLDWNSDTAEKLVDATIAGYAKDAGAAPLVDNFPVIDQCFSAATVEEIVEKLENDGSDFAKLTLKFLSKKSPLSMKVSFKQLREGKDLDFDACMQMEFRLSQGCARGTEFYEGVRSVLVDKDHKPVWSPSRLEEVTGEMVDSHFESLNDKELVFS